ncbi:MAG TPA: helix-turn-helix transcriptional regulator [Hyphomicrobiaceae bacterium]|jgi:DNA-binding CsgD family transcriptional regulator|nr:helix-turn-helix transcriptional regulator [Hyphomicrobiaceae bacterium]
MHDDLLDIVGDIYDCAIEPKRWPATLERIVDHVGGACGGIHVHDPTQRQVRFVAECRTDPEYQRSYGEAYAALNPMLTSGWFAGLDEPITICGTLGEETYRQTRIYREWSKPQGYLDAAAVTLAKSARRHAQAAIIRFERQGVFDMASLQPLRLLAPHIRRSVTIADLLDARALCDDMLSATLDLLVVGILLVDGEARIVHANRAGARHLIEAQAVRRSDDRLSARDPAAAVALRDAISKATQAGAALELAKTGIAVPVTGADGRDLAAWVLPLDSGLRTEFAAPFAAKAAVFLREIGDTAPLPGELFVRRYGITAAECRVLMLLTQGMSPRETADTLGCSEPTVRTHMQRLFAKTGTGGQPDLIRLAMSALAPAST